ncbi:glycosyltransferase [Sinorhizobium sp. BG8]|uniref:glycosyltransferase family 32 protein n=1 Tax=Sinorhizobium sp. BG8 TaxID=2613773 RepID=UPI00193D58F6|nr:glycosyltransferase [Sinorhizobium sp. BG8]QRM53881.1 mannosyltransferase [Sinorhizobium sp. BG8]
MKTKHHYAAILEEARALQEQRRFDEVRVMYDALVADPDNHLLGTPTAIGLPRRLHAAMLRLAKAEGDPLKRIGYQFNLVPPPAMTEKYGRFDAAERKALAAASREAVPRVIHQIWIGPNEPPASTVAWAEHAAAHGYEYRLWREGELSEAGFDGDPVFAGMLEDGDYPGAVDVARYAILEEFGGIYLDCDWYPARRDVSFHDFLPLVGLSALAEDVPRNTSAGSLLLTNSFIAAPPRHLVFRRTLEALPHLREAMPGAPAWWSTGPLIFTVVSRGGPVSIPDASFVAASVARGTPHEEVKALCKAADENEAGLLLAWKSW